VYLPLSAVAGQPLRTHSSISACRQRTDRPPTRIGRGICSADSIAQTLRGDTLRASATSCTFHNRMSNPFMQRRAPIAAALQAAYHALAQGFPKRHASNKKGVRFAGDGVRNAVCLSAGGQSGTVGGHHFAVVYERAVRSRASQDAKMYFGSCGPRSVSSFQCIGSGFALRQRRTAFSKASSRLS